MKSEKGVMIRDSVHKTIRVPEFFKKIIDTPTFQRLKGVKQIGLANLLYPGANGTRFEHALGAYYLATQTKKRFQQFLLHPPPKTKCIDLDAQDYKLLETAALLHDIGHAPFSHAIDELPWFNHEETTKKLILDSEITDILETVGSITPTHVVDVLQPTLKTPLNRVLLSDILAGPLGIDMLDYLQRDALYSGVPYGRVDTDRLFETIELHPEEQPMIIINDKGILPVESIFFSRFAMFQSVYLHHVVRIAHRMLQRAIQKALKSNGGWLDPQDLIFMQDDELLYRLQTESQESVSNTVKAIKSRNLFKRIGQVTWADLETQGWSPQQIQEFVVQGVKTRKSQHLLGELTSALQGTITSLDDLLLDFPPLVSKTVSGLHVRLRHKHVDSLKPFRHPSISAIGSYVDRAYQLLWKIQIFGDRSLASKKRETIIDAWNSQFQNMQILP